MKLFVKPTTRARDVLRKTQAELAALERTHMRELDQKKKQRASAVADARRVANANARAFQAKRKREQDEALKG